MHGTWTIHAMVPGVDWVIMCVDTLCSYICKCVYVHVCVHAMLICKVSVCVCVLNVTRMSAQMVHLATNHWVCAGHGDSSIQVKKRDRSEHLPRSTYTYTSQCIGTSTQLVVTAAGTAALCCWSVCWGMCQHYCLWGDMFTSTDLSKFTGWQVFGVNLVCSTS